MRFSVCLIDAQDNRILERSLIELPQFPHPGEFIFLREGEDILKVAQVLRVNWVLENKTGNFSSAVIECTLVESDPNGEVSDSFEAEQQIQDASDLNGFVAFCDILGFSARVRREFDAVTQLYDTFSGLIIDLRIENVHVSIFSDSIIMISFDFYRIVDAINALWFAAQTHFFIMRGGLAYGRIWSRRRTQNLIIVSDALIRAVEIEKTVKRPVVQVAPEIQIPVQAWIPRFSEGPMLARL